MSQWDKLIRDILGKNPNLRFEDLAKALERMGYVCHQPRGGSSHYTFRKEGCLPITIPKQTPLRKAYIELVAEAVRNYLKEEKA